MHPDIFWVVLVTGSATGLPHKNPIVMIMAGNERFKNVVRCSETGGAPHLEELVACFKPLPTQYNTGSRWNCVDACLDDT